MKKLFKKPLIIIIIVVIILLGFKLSWPHKKIIDNLFSVKKEDLIQEVSVTGHVKAAEEVNLAFEKTGKVSATYVKIGDQVIANQMLVALNNTDIRAQLSQAEAQLENAKANLKQYQAALDNQQAKLDDLKAGARPEDVDAKKSELKKTQQDLDNYYDNVLNALNDSYVKADDAARKQTMDLFSDAETNNPEITFITADSQARIDIINQRILVSSELNNWQTELNNLKNSANQNNLEQGIKNAKLRLTMIRTFLNRTMDALNGALSISSTTLTTYKTNINTARTNINIAAASINSAEQLILSQKIYVEKIQNELNLKLAGATIDQINAQEDLVQQAAASVKAQEAQIKNAEANVEYTNAQLAKTYLVAPFDGIITKQDAKVGEIVNANTPVVSLISAAEFEVEANVPEADIAKIKIENAAKITLDAYGNDVIFESKVTKIDPAETIIDGVATYKTTLQFNTKDDRLKSGMTANIDIETDKRNNVLAVPQRAIIQKNGEEFVMKLGDDQKQIEQKVQTGLRGSDGNIEIINGLKENDQILSFIKEK